MAKRVVKYIVGVALLAALFMLPHSSIAAAAGATVTVSGAEDRAEETVEVTVSIEGLSSLDGVEGISGGEIEISYDPVLASVTKIKQGELLSEAIFIFNENYSNNSVFITWVSADNLLSGDGTLCTIIFTLKETGLLTPLIRSISVCDQLLRLLDVVQVATSKGGPAEENGSTSVTLEPSTEIEQASSPTGDSAVIPEEEENEFETVGPGGAPAENKSSVNGWFIYTGIAIMVTIVIGAVYYLFRRRSRSAVK